MKSKTNKSIRVMLSVVFLLVISCATTPKLPPPSPEELKLRADLGRIGIVSASFQPEVGFQKPMSKGAAAWHGAAHRVRVLGEGQGDGFLFVYLVTLPLWMIIGGIVGAIQAVPSEKIKETEDALNGCLATLNLQETMRERFLKTAREQTQYPFVLLEVQGPKALDEEVTYGSLQDKGIDTILEIAVCKCELWGEKGVMDPHIRLRMAAGIRLIRTTDGHVLFSRNFVYDYGGTSLFSRDFDYMQQGGGPPYILRMGC